MPAVTPPSQSAKNEQLTPSNEGSGKQPEDGIAERINAVRESKGLNHEGLASLTKIVDSEGKGISRTTVRGYELGLYKPGAREIRLLCSALEVSPNWLLLGIDSGINSMADGATQTAESEFPLMKGLKAGLAFINIERKDKELVSDVIFALLKAKLGEVEFRKWDALIDETFSMFNDYMADLKEGHRPTQEDLKKLGEVAIPFLMSKHGFNKNPFFVDDSPPPNND